jgi:hypothetical protein
LKKQDSSFTLESWKTDRGVNDELSSIIPVGNPGEGAFAEFEQLARGECGVVQLWGDASGKLSTRERGATGELRGTDYQHDATVATVSEQQPFSAGGFF